MFWIRSLHFPLAIVDLISLSYVSFTLAIPLLVGALTCAAIPCFSLRFQVKTSSLRSTCRWGLLHMCGAFLRPCHSDTCPNSVGPGTTSSALVMPIRAMVSLVCRTCGTTKKLGNRSCCGPGDSWFKNCGDTGDTEFDHTWAEGIIARQSELMRDWVCFVHCIMYYAIQTFFLLSHIAF